MRIVKMSLVAALLVGSSAFAVENVKMSGDANVFYNTSDANDATLFDKDSSAADAGLNLNVVADLFSNDMVTVSTGVGYTALSTLGLENNLVSGVWGSAHGATIGTDASYAGAFNGAKVENATWFNEAYVTVATGKTIAKIGRMELDTPLAFTEKWSIEKNTFEAAVLINQDIPDTTVVAAFVGNGNRTETFGQNVNGTVIANGLAMGALVNENGDFTTYGSDGAYALGVVNNSVEPLTVQAWYYDVSRLVQAYWLQADVKIEEIMAGAQYSAHEIDTTDLKAGLGTTGTAVKVDSDVYAVMLGYEMKDMFTAKVAYSQVGKDYAAGFNTATATDTAQTKLYTEAWWNYGRVTQADTVAYNLTVEVPVQDVADFGVYYTYADQAKNTGPNDLTEFTLTAGQSFGPLDATLAIINAKVAKADATNTVQAYVTLNF